MLKFLDIALIITSVGLILSVLLQSKGAGLGGLTGSDASSVFTARRGIERVLFWITIVLSVAFFTLAVLVVVLGR
ncbi:MAG: preprotein translocase subunit SecG [Chloroflexi bacterium]|nr:preprotein translocase subunit SecG [Chloroflexota bacterium]MBI1854308.1 preprotein translocase subunit SecG [Chloroflexota bacterium]MBI2757069.1 preprotein translocase subunit SecG [Chloroflexota bacterium]MBI3341231.1 preprotein translocase subunit SecG [Chloroflexota bacterium]